MKLKQSILALTALVGVALTAPSARAAVTYTAGDLLMGFRVTGGVGSDKTYVFNLGSSTDFRNGNFANFSFNLGTDLDATFGTTAGSALAWNERTDLYWGIIGVRSNSFPGSAVGGDPSRTIYASKAQESYGTQSTAWEVSASGDRGTASTDAVTFENAFKTYDATANSSNRGAVINTSEVNSWEDFQPDGALRAASFAAFNPSIEGSFGGGTMAGSGTYEGALDVYRILNTNTGANPTGTVGVGSYEGTFRIDSTGAVSAVPEPSTYALLGLAGIAFIAWKRRKSAAQA